MAEVDHGQAVGVALPIVLKAADVIAAARKAYEEGRLSAQGPTPKCMYRDPSNRPCAIGASLPDDVAGVWDGCLGGMVVQQAVFNGHAETDDLDALAALQATHDRWSRCVASGVIGRSAESAFRDLIGLDPFAAPGPV